MKSAPTTPTKPVKPRPRFQFTVTGLLVLMFAFGAMAAPGYYLLRGAELPQAKLVGMVMMLAGPLLLMTLLSIFLSLSGRRNGP
jgi:hypothetical protein